MPDALPVALDAEGLEKRLALFALELLLGPVDPDRVDAERMGGKHEVAHHERTVVDGCERLLVRHDGEDDHPASMQYSQGSIKFRHYGKAMESMIAAAADMEEGEERDALVSQIAHAMKRLYVHWNSDNDDDDLIRQQLHDLSGGRITLPAGFQFHDSKYYADSVAASNGKKEGGKKKKKKKNK